MDEDSLISDVSLVLGIIVTSSGLALVASSAFDAAVFRVFFGFVLVSVGYKVSWLGAHRFESFEDISEKTGSLKGSSGYLKDGFRNLVLIFVGLMMCAEGTVLFAELVISFDLVLAFLSGFACFTGYLVAHQGINEVAI
ncbi:hypothetical protein [Candidatus Nanohalobium constans]|uniref:Uncharacterized protein n=1 Tax=Candidatus Nanohalobium constans TaxID=2565781 RepID=A0A5Q0UJE2_9ARCH|nr:hypothetical protein [Candidatus Nanohalobium constans]QGA80949.1 hypothetical protein LC1Nh_1078 [Candidatus Nanohalobium constans]